MLFTRIACCIGFALSVSVFVQMDVYAQSTDTLAVQLENGTLSDEGLVEGIDVTLHIIDQQNGAVLASGIADIYGRVDFNDIPIIDDASYLIVAEYQGVSYHKLLNVTHLGKSHTLTVYGTTDLFDEILIEEQSVIVGSADSTNRLLTVYERVTMVNYGDRTFVPDFDQPQNMQFLRFSLPRGADNLQVETTFEQGEIMTVDKGFALTSRVPPGSYLVDYIYTVPYSDASLELNRSFTNRTDIFRVLIPAELGSLGSVSGIVPSSVLIQGKEFDLVETSNISSGTKLNLVFNKLPEPTLLENMKAHFDRVSQLGLVLGLITSLLLLSLGIFAFGRIRRDGRNSRDIEPVLSDIADRSLLQEIVHLEILYRDQKIEWRKYRKDRQEIKLKLVEQYFAEEGLPS